MRAMANDSEKRLRPAPRSGDVVGRVGRQSHDFDEGPTPDDLERFGGVTRPCPSCGKDVYDDAMMCAHCGASMEEDRLSRGGKGKGIMFVLVVLSLVLLMLFLSGVLGPLRR